VNEGIDRAQVDAGEGGSEDGDGGDAGGIMAGLTDVERAVPDHAPVERAQTAHADTLQRTLSIICGGGFMASVASSGGLASDFHPAFFVKTHPMSFPHGAGAKPAGMSFNRYGRLLAKRMVGRAADRGGEDVVLLLALFNVTQRHTILAETRGRLRGRTADVERVARMSDEDYDRMYNALVTGVWQNVLLVL
jgi:hypothetical protein